MLLGPADAPFVGEEQQIAVLHILNLLGVGGQVQLFQVDIRIVNPPDVLIGEVLHANLHIVFVLHPVFEHVKLQGAHHAHNDLFQAAAHVVENLDSALLGNLGDALDKLLALHGVLLLDPAEKFRGKGGDALELHFHARGAHGVANGENARVKHADNVPGIGLLDDFPALGHHLLGLRELHFPPALNVEHFHALFKPAGANAHKGDAVPMGLVHVGLNLKHKGGETRVKGVHHAVLGLPGQGGAGQLQKALQEGLHAKVGQSGTEKHRGELALLHLLQIKLGACAIQELHIVPQGLIEFLAQTLLHGGIVQGGLGGLHFPLAAVQGKGQSLLLFPVIDSLEIPTAADGPVHRIGLNAQLILDFIQQIIGVPGFPVHFVDKGENGNVPHDADLKELPGLGLHALGSVDDHDCGVRRHEGAVGVLREVLVAGGVQNIDAEAFILELHDGRGHRNTALLFNFHPVGDRMAAVLFALDRAGQGNGAAVEQEFFR